MNMRLLFGIIWGESATNKICVSETTFFDNKEFEEKWIIADSLPQLDKNPPTQAYEEWNGMIAAMMRRENIEMRMESDIWEELPLE